ncbi:MAG: helix-turn-helix domain-containing protein [Pseudomonadota bacterium]
MNATAEAGPLLPLLEGVTIQKSAEAWEQSTSVFDLAPMNTHNNTGVFIARTWITNMCVFGHLVFDANTHAHGAKHINDTGDLILVYRFLEGEAFGQIKDMPYTIRPGLMMIRDYAFPFEGMQTPCLIQGVYVHYDLLRHGSEYRTPQLCFSADTAMGRVLHAEFDAIFGQLLSGSKSLSLVRLNRFISCVKLAISKGNVEQDVRVQAREALGAAIRAHIEAHLAMPELNSEYILRTFGVSRATLYRIFEPFGGVRTYISNRRLFRAVMQISKDPMTRGEITRAAEKWGFSSDANFNRSVRRTFGASPNSLFGQPLKMPPRQFPRQTISQTVASTLGNREFATP